MAARGREHRGTRNAIDALDQHAFDQLVDPVADKRFDLTLRERRIPEGLQHRVGRQREIGRGVDERAIEVERYDTNTFKETRHALAPLRGR